MKNDLNSYQTEIFVEKKKYLIPSFLEYIDTNNITKEYTQTSHSIIERACKEGLVDLVKGLYKKTGFCVDCFKYALKLHDPQIRNIFTSVADEKILSLIFKEGLDVSVNWAKSVIDRVIPEEVVEPIVDKQNYWMLNALFKRGLNINKTIGLEVAALNDDLEMVEYLIKNGAIKFDHALLMLCQRNGPIEMAKYFINHGASNIKECKYYAKGEMLRLLNNTKYY